MTTPDINSPAPTPERTPACCATSTEVPDWEAAHRSLRSQMTAILIIFLFFGLGVNLFIYKELVVVHRQAAENYRLQQEFNTKSAPEMERFIAALRDFGRMHPDFGAVLAKYFRTNAPAGSTSAPPAAPASPAAPEAR
ncbi:MAG TPA: hypothetical protein P5555_17630 [Candidatus Paceibacterota bacterium]|nr:hypothetical protein [Verrucomicrobiota bacterium]HRZ47001.1 hypothetical protein [Candidatus Paceibacterota bacterium]